MGLLYLVYETWDLIQNEEYRLMKQVIMQHVMQRHRKDMYN
jgi:hypothetical protein